VFSPILLTGSNFMLQLLALFLPTDIVQYYLRNSDTRIVHKANSFRFNRDDKRANPVFGKGVRNGIWGTEVPSGVQGQSPGRGSWDEVPQKPTIFCKLYYNGVL